MTTYVKMSYNDYPSITNAEFYGSIADFEDVVSDLGGQATISRKRTHKCGFGDAIFKVTNVTWEQLETKWKELSEDEWTSHGSYFLSRVEK